MLPILSSITSIFILIAVGAIAGAIIRHRQHLSGPLLCRLGIECESWTEALNKYVLYIAFPVLLFHSIATIGREQIEGSTVFIATTILLIAIIGGAFFITKALKLSAPLANSYIFGAFFGNVAYIGFPFLILLYPTAAGHLSLLIAIHVFVAFTLGISILEYSKHGTSTISQILLRAIKSPLLIAVFLGLVFLLLNIPLPALILQALVSIGGSATPVILIALGMFLVESFRIERKMWHGLAIGVIKIVVMPLIFFLTANSLGLIEIMRFSIVEAAMPVALTNFALAEVYPMDKRVVTHSIVFSTLLSLFTIPVFSMLVL